MMDIWREQNKMIRDYTHFLGRHNSFSGIDYIFQQSGSCIQVDKVDIELRTHQDHTTVLVQCRVQEKQGGVRVWQLDNSLLLNGEVGSRVKKEMEVFFDTNQVTKDKALLLDTYLQSLLQGHFDEPKELHKEKETRFLRGES